MRDIYLIWIVYIVVFFALVWRMEKQAQKIERLEKTVAEMEKKEWDHWVEMEFQKAGNLGEKRGEKLVKKAIF